MLRRDGPSTTATKEDSQAMTYDIGSVQGARAMPSSVRPTSRATAPNNVKTTSAAVKVDVASAIPPSPPTEVLDAMGVAAAAHDNLTASGHGLSFKLDDATGRVVVTVHDADGHALFSVPGSKALEIASGAPLSQ